MTYIYTRETTSSIAHALTNDSYASWHANYAACMALAEYLEGLAEDIGEPIELDTVALRCLLASTTERHKPLIMRMKKNLRMPC